MSDKKEKVKVKDNLFVFEPEEKDQSGKWFSFMLGDKEIKLKLSPLTRSEIRKNRKKYTNVKFDPKSHQKIVVEDPEEKRKCTDDLFYLKCTDWDVCQNNGGKIEKIEFSQDIYRKFLDKYGMWKIEQDIDDEGNVVDITLYEKIDRTIADPANFYTDDSENL